MRHEQTSAGAFAPQAQMIIHQAIFTSVYSRVAKGYRLVACSPGIRADERQEIVPLCPSHGNLLDDGPEAEAFASLVLQSGRRCLLLSRHAGEEYSGRGGQRVHTHVLVFEPESFRRFSFDAARVAAAAIPAIPDEWFETPPTDMEDIELSVAPSPLTEAPLAFKPGEVAALESVVSALLDRRSVVLLDDPHPVRTLAALTAAIPAWQRAALTHSWGMRHTTARSVQLIMMSGTPADIERARVDGRTAIVAWPNEAAPRPATESTSDVPVHIARAAMRTLEAQAADLPPATNASESASPNPFIRERPPSPRNLIRAVPPPRPVHRAPEPPRGGPSRAAGGFVAEAHGESAPRAAGFEEWLAFCARHWGSGDFASLQVISDSLDQPMDSAVLRRIVRLASALDEIASAEEPQLEEMQRDFQPDIEKDGLHGELGRRVCEAIESRLAALRPRPEDIAFMQAPKGLYY